MDHYLSHDIERQARAFWYRCPCVADEEFIIIVITVTSPISTTAIKYGGLPLLELN